MDIWLCTLWLLAHQEQQRAAPASGHHRIAAYNGVKRIRFQFLLQDGTAG